MGTNFYMITKNKKLAEKYAPYSYSLTDTPDWGYEIHVAKTSCGWLPLFEAHENGIKSVKEYKELFDTNEVKIFDEYDEEYNWEQFTKRVLEFNGGKVGVIEPTLEKGIKGEEQYIPISHLSNNKQSYKYYGFSVVNHFADDEGYEFVYGDFS